MPQPEQWMSEHPFWTFLIGAAFVVGFCLLGWLT